MRNCLRTEDGGWRGEVGESGDGGVEQDEKAEQEWEGGRLRGELRRARGSAAGWMRQRAGEECGRAGQERRGQKGGG